MVRLVLNLACIAKQCMTEQPLRYLQPLGARFCDVAELSASGFLDELLLWLYFADAVYSPTEEAVHACLDEKLSMRNKAHSANLNLSQRQHVCGLPPACRPPRRSPAAPGARTRIVFASQTQTTPTRRLYANRPKWGTDHGRSM